MAQSVLVRMQEVNAVPHGSYGSRGRGARGEAPHRTGTASASPATARRGMVTGALAAAVLLGVSGTGLAVPPPPPNPSDSELENSRRVADERAGEVGRLSGELARVQARLAQLRDEVALKLEEANRALVDLSQARSAAEAAQRDADAARAEADAAAAAIERARKDFDRFVAGSYQQGSTIGSVGAYLGSDNPKDLLDRAQLLEAVGGSQLDALRGLRKARIEKANSDAAARAALRLARQRRAEAEQAKVAADEAKAAAVAAQRSQAARTAEVEAEKQRVEQRLFEAQRRAHGLEGQRERYEEWLARKRREEQQQLAQAAGAAPVSHAGSSVSSGSSGSSATVEDVIARAMSQLGVPYAWGGGNASGPTYGIRDGGVADSYGDYNKVGFDCSGLMIYAFADVQSLPHYSGYQYNAGRRVPLSQAKRGDMLFWGPSRIHHVALYLGDGRMIEAPYSGSHVRVAPVRYGGIMPYAVRLVD